MSIKEAAQSLLDRYWRSLPGNFRGAIWVLLSAFTFILLQALTKQLGGRFDSIQLAFFRASIGGLAVLPFIFSRGSSAFRTENLPYHVGRGLFGAMAIFLMVFAIIHMPLADATVIGFTRTLASELAARKVTANAIAPGFIETEMTAELGEVVLDAAKKRIPAKRLGQPSDVADAVLFLASNAATGSR